MTACRLNLNEINPHPRTLKQSQQGSKQVNSLTNASAEQWRMAINEQELENTEQSLEVRYRGLGHFFQGTDETATGYPNRKCGRVLHQRKRRTI